MGIAGIAPAKRLKHKGLETKRGRRAREGWRWTLREAVQIITNHQSPLAFRISFWNLRRFSSVTVAQRFCES